MKYFILSLFVLITTGTAYAQERLSWLPSEQDKQTTFSKETNAFLRSLNSQMRILGCQYDEARLVGTETIKQEGSSTTTAGWSCSLRTEKVAGEKEAMDLLFTFTRTGSRVNDAGVAIAFDFPKWTPQNYLLIPASVYNGNRNRIVKRGYNEGLDRNELYWPGLPQTTTELPQLSPNAGELSRLEVHTSNTTTPSICLLDKERNQGFIILTEQGMTSGNAMIDHGFIVEECSDRRAATLVINAPGVREKKPEFVGFSKSPDRGITWEVGEERTLRMRIYKFPAKEIPALLDKFMTVRKTVTGATSPRKLIPMSETLRLMSLNIDKRYYEGEPYSFYCPENAEWISFGWIGGLMNTFPMLALGDKAHRDKVKSTFDFGLARGQGKSGYFWGALNKDGTPFGREGYDDCPEIVLTRKNADVLYWMVKQFLLLKAQGHGEEIKPEWESSIKRLADAFVATWKKHGQWGNHLNHETGDIALYNTTSGVSAIGGLALAAEYYGEPNYLALAMEAADYYYTHYFLAEGMTTGACADILQNSDSESASAFMTSLMGLYETTRNKKWLKMSQDLAHLCATWTTSFDYQLPSNTTLAKLNAKLTGAVWASTQNKHGAPGFCTLSGDALFKLFRTTGDVRYAELMRDIIHAHSEGVQPNGQITERLTYCDADSRGSRGDGGKTGWNETNGALMALEIPGIYVRTDRNCFYVFDQVNAEVVTRGKEGVLLQITNPTNHDAFVTLLAENKTTAQSTLGVTGFLGWSRVAVKAGETIQHWVR